MSADNRRRKRNQILSWGINLAGILVFALILYLGGVEAWQQIVQGDWRYVLAAFAVTLLWNLVAAYRWSIIANQLAGRKICPYRYFFTYHMIGMLIGQVVPVTVGMLGGRPVALSLSQGVSLKRSALSVFLDKLFDLILALLLVVPVALYLVDWISQTLALGLIAGVVVLGGIVVAWQYEWAIRVTGRAASRMAEPLARIPVLGQRLARRLPAQLDRLSSETLVPNQLAGRAFFLTLVMYGLLSVRLFFISEALHLNIPWYLLAMGVCVAQLALVFAITPGSLGFLEAGWGAVLGLAGLSQEQFIFFVIARRTYMFVFTLVNTLLAFAWIRESPAQLFRAVLVASRQPATGPEVSATGGSAAMQSPASTGTGDGVPARSEAQNGSPSVAVR
jgi:uncharacterized protein (TIRG00374 family)